MKLCFYILGFFLIVTSCDLPHWDLDKIEYLNFELPSALEKVFAPTYKTEIVERGNQGIFWAGRMSSVCGLTNYQYKDTIFDLKLLRQGFHSNVMFPDKDTILMTFNGDGNLSVLQIGFDGSFINEYLDLVLYVRSKIGAVNQVVIHDMTVSNDIYILAGEVKQTIGEPRTILIGMSRSLQPLWVRTYISNSFATNVETSMSGDIFISGVRNGHNYILKTNISETIFFVRDFIEIGRDSVSDMKYQNGRLYFTSCLKQYPFKTRVVSFDDNLKEIWFVDLSTIDTNHPVITLNRNGNLVIGYASYSIIYLTELDNQFGTNVWCNRYAKDKNYAPKGVIQTGDFGYLMLSESSNGEQLVIKTDEEGATRLHPFSQFCH